MGEGRGGGVKEASGIFSHLPFPKGGPGGIFPPRKLKTSICAGISLINTQMLLSLRPCPQKPSCRITIIVVTGVRFLDRAIDEEIRTSSIELSPRCSL